MDFPLLDVMDEGACYAKLLQLLHPDGLVCPRCRAREGLRVHRRHREPVLDYQCDPCGRVFNAWTGTVLEGTPRRPSTVWLILRGIAQGTPTAQLARELKCDRMKLLFLRHRWQALARQALCQRPLPDAVTEADEMYQNAGEKRYSASRPRGSATATWQSGPGAWHVGKRPSSRGGSGRPRLRASPPGSGQTCGP